MGLAFGKRELLESWRPYKVRPAANEPVGHRFEHGTQQHELLAGFVAAVEYIESLGWDAIVGARARARDSASWTGLPETVELYGLRTMDGRVPDLLLQRARPQRRAGGDRARRAGDRRLARRLLRRRDDAPPRARKARAPFARASSTTTPPPRSTGCSPRWKSCAAPRPRRDALPRPRDRGGGARARARADALQPRRDERRALPGSREAARRPDVGSLRARRAAPGTRCIDPSGYVPARRSPLGRGCCAIPAATSSSRASRSTRTSTRLEPKATRPPSSATRRPTSWPRTTRTTAR